MRRGAPFYGAALLVALGCRQLPDLPRGACGNGVVEPPEDCDGFPRLGSECRPPGAAAECRLDCSPHPDGARPSCPAGFGCDRDDVCRHETGRFVAMPDIVPGNANALLAGDFDGDGRDDLVAEETAGALGFTKLRVHFFDEGARVSSTWASEKSVLLRPAITDVSGDGRADLVFTDGLVGSLLGKSDRSLVPEAYPSYFVPRARTRFVAVFDRDVEGGGPFVMLTQLFGAFGLYRGEALTGALLTVAELSAGVDGLAAEPVAADLFEDDQRYPCADVVLAYRDANEVLVYSPCERATDGGQVRWREKAELARVPLPEGVRIDEGLLLADLNGDAHQDLLVGASQRCYVAYGDGSSLSPLTPFVAFLDDLKEYEFPVPLAAGDFTGDGIADLAYPHFLLLSRASEQGLFYESDFDGFGAPWSEAVIADFNANGYPDVALASRDALDIDFFNGTGSSRLNAFLIPTTRPSGQLATGDFDGDLIEDLAFVQKGSAGASDELSISFGAGAGVPDPPLAVGNLPGIEQVEALPGNPRQTTSQLIVTYTEKDEHGDNGSALAILDAGGDRSLLARIELNRFATDGVVQAVPAVALAVGVFEVPGRLDVAAVSIAQDLSNRDLGVWLMRDLGSRRATPFDLGWPFAERIQPVANVETIAELTLGMAAGDLDGDGLDEIVIVSRRESEAPEPAGRTVPATEHCVLSIASFEGATEPRLLPRESLTIEERWSQDSQLAVGDVDGDGYADIVLLTGEPAGPRSLLVLWNDGGREFVVDEILADEAVPVQGFAVFRSGTNATPHLAYVKETEVRLLSSPVPRVLVDDGRVAELERGTGIVAADVDGDGVTDLAVADSGGVRVLRAELDR